MKNSYKNLIKSHFNEHALVLQSTSLNMIDILEKASSKLSQVLSNGKKFLVRKWRKCIRQCTSFSRTYR